MSPVCFQTRPVCSAFTHTHTGRLLTRSFFVEAGKRISDDVLGVCAVEALSKHGKEHCEVDGTRSLAHHALQIFIRWVLTWGKRDTLRVGEDHGGARHFQLPPNLIQYCPFSFTLFFCQHKEDFLLTCDSIAMSCLCERFLSRYVKYSSFRFNTSPFELFKT